jgi:hypothetical protein
VSVTVSAQVPFVHESEVGLAVQACCEAKDLLDYLPYGDRMRGLLKVSLNDREGRIECLTSLDSAFAEFACGLRADAFASQTGCTGCQWCVRA